MSPAFKGRYENSKPHKPLLPTALAGLSLSEDDSKSQEFISKTLWLIFHLLLKFHKLSTSVVMSTEICWEKEGNIVSGIFGGQSLTLTVNKIYVT